MDGVFDEGVAVDDGEVADGEADGVVADNMDITLAEVDLREGHGVAGRGDDDVVDPGAVAAVAHAIVFCIAEGEGVGAGAEGVGGAGPVDIARGVELRYVVDQEVEFIVVGFGRDTVVETHAVGGRHVDGQRCLGGLAVSYVDGRAHAMGTFDCLRVDDCPWVLYVGHPTGEVGGAALEGLGEGLPDEYGQVSGEGAVGVTDGHGDVHRQGGVGMEGQADGGVAGRSQSKGGRAGRCGGEERCGGAEGQCLHRAWGVADVAQGGGKGKVAAWKHGRC